MRLSGSYRGPVAMLSLKSAGFALVELLVVFAILGLAMAVVPVAWQRLDEAAEYRSTVRNLLTGLRQARTQAMLKGRPVSFSVDAASKRFGLDGNLAQAIGSQLAVRLTVAAEMLSAPGRGSIVFYPDGGATGGSIELLRPSGGGVRLRVDWLLGHVTQNPPGDDAPVR